MKSDNSIRQGIVLVYGGSGSGKSQFAEDYLKDFKNKYYIATMKVYGQEGLKRVSKHRKQREGKDFITIEKCCDVASIPKENQIPINSVALLECMSNLVANEMFRDENITPEQIVIERILHGIKQLTAAFDLLVIVTNNTFEDGNEYDESTLGYMRTLGEINAKLARASKEVYEVVASVPVQLKESTLIQGSGLILIVGGFAQGKYEYAKSQYPDKNIFDKFHLWVREQLLLEKTKEQILSEIEAYLQDNNEAVIICDEIGNGIVPMGKFDRDYRDILGSITQYLAGKASTVERVVCGLAQRLK